VEFQQMTGREMHQTAYELVFDWMAAGADDRKCIGALLNAASNLAGAFSYCDEEIEARAREFAEEGRRFRDSIVHSDD